MHNRRIQMGGILSEGNYQDRKMLFGIQIRILTKSIKILIMNSENLHSKSAGPVDQPELHFQADSLNLKPQLEDPVPLNKSTSSQLKRQRSIDLCSSQDLTFDQNKDISVAQQNTQFISFLPIQYHFQSLGMEESSRERRIGRQIQANQRKMLQNLKKIQKQFKNVGAEKREELLSVLQTMKKRFINMLKKHRRD